MKKNLISVLILALLVVNLALTAIMMFSVTSASKKTAALVDDIAKTLNLELKAQTGNAGTPAVPIADIETYSLEGGEALTIALKPDEDGTAHYCLVSITFSINMKADGYKTYGSDLSAQEELIKGEVISVFGQYTMAEARANETQIREEILTHVQNMYDSDHIFNVSFGSIIYS